jgi:hypothetical protein
MNKSNAKNENENHVMRELLRLCIKCVGVANHREHATDAVFEAPDDMRIRANSSVHDINSECEDEDDNGESESESVGNDESVPAPGSLARRQLIEQLHRMIQREVAHQLDSRMRALALSPRRRESEVSSTAHPTFAQLAEMEHALSAERARTTQLEAQLLRATPEDAEFVSLPAITVTAPAPAPEPAQTDAELAPPLQLSRQHLPPDCVFLTPTPHGSNNNNNNNSNTYNSKPRTQLGYEVGASVTSAAFASSSKPRRRDLSGMGVIGSVGSSGRAHGAQKQR